ncbi:DNA/RNA nuclease SfsA [Candidatus Woesearchaeota archaeon]|nr:DNA/RNA nuclease SfsA [Candidatus Woesearchaeota archaeon]
MDYEFEEKLTEGLIKSRPNRFIIMVEINGKIHKSHCPSTGRIGDVDFKDIPCLVSKANTPNRSTDFTVEAISLDSLNKANRTWIGINQTKINRYIEFFIKNNFFSNLVKKESDVRRESKLGASRIDFKVGNDYLEVKMPLIMLPTSNVPRRTHSKFDSFDRLIKHFNDLADSIDENSRAIILLCYMYDAKPFVRPALDKDNRKIIHAANRSQQKGVENWQANLKINEKGVSLEKYFKLNLF